MLKKISIPLTAAAMAFFFALYLQSAESGYALLHMQIDFIVYFSALLGIAAMLRFFEPLIAFHYIYIITALLYWIAGFRSETMPGDPYAAYMMPISIFTPMFIIFNHVNTVIRKNIDRHWEERSRPLNERFDVINDEITFSTAENTQLHMMASHIMKLYEVSQDFQKTMDLDTFLRLSGHHIMQFVSFKAGAIVVFNPQDKTDSHRILLDHALGRDHDERLNGVMMEFIRSGQLNQVQKNQAVFTMDSNQPVYSERKNLDHDIIAAGLFFETRVIGLIWLKKKEEDADDLGENLINAITSLKILSAQIGINLRKILLYKNVEDMAIYDSLTGLRMQKRFMEILEWEVRRAEIENNHLALLMIDIDHFKPFNDTYGHQTGDEVLRRVANNLNESIRSVDIPARYGGEEFSVVLPQCDLDHATEIAWRICTSIAENEMNVDGQLLSVTVSVGVAAYPGQAQDYISLIQEADRYLYQAKAAGRNRVCGPDTAAPEQV